MFFNTEHFVNADDDADGLDLSFAAGSRVTTSEMGDRVHALLRLTSKPMGEVLLTSAVSHPMEARVDPALFVLGPDTWNKGVVMTLTGKQNVVRLNRAQHSALPYKLRYGHRDSKEIAYEQLGVSFACFL